MNTAGRRRLRILGRLAGAGDGGIDARNLCLACADIVGTTGAGILLITGDEPQGSLCTTDAVSAAIEDLQFSLGEGPCIDACLQGRPIFESDLMAPSEPRWPAFSPAAVEASARAVFGFPLQVGAARFGALNLYCDRPGPLSDEQYADALVTADVAAQIVLMLQAEAPPGLLGTALEAGSDFQHVVHQAAGMVAAQLDISVTQALVVLRARAFGDGAPLKEMAASVVARQLRFGDPEP